MAPEQLFIQRAVQWVKPGGRIGIVLPNGILSNPGPTDEGIRTWILRELLGSRRASNSRWRRSSMRLA